MLRYLFPLYCCLCRAPLKTSTAICQLCLTELPDYPQLCFYKKDWLGYAGYHYAGHIKTLITQLKFNHKLAHSKLLAKLMVEKIQQHYTAFPTLLIPVPLHKKRLQERGFNQTLEIAKLIANEIKIKVDTESVFRKKATQAQAQLSIAERKQNIKNAFELKHDIQSHHAILFDDVVTTGSTINECLKVLTQTRIQQIDIWCVAKAS